MAAPESLDARFEEQRPHLRAVAYRMLGSFAEADDAVQDAWLRLSRTDASTIENLPGWLTTVVSRLCLNQLRSRGRRREDPLELRLADPIVTPDGPTDPAHEAELAESVGLAMLVVLDALAPAERVAFVLHDLFAVPFDEIAEVLDRTPAATRQLASRARRRVQDTAPSPDADLVRQREVVTAFFAAARDGDLAGLIALLDPEIVLRADGGLAEARLSRVTVGAEAVASGAIMFANPRRTIVPVLVNGGAGAVIVGPKGPVSVMAFSIVGDRVAEIDVLADPARLAALDLPTTG